MWQAAVASLVPAASAQWEFHDLLGQYLFGYMWHSSSS
jgi:hypothetical protein